MLAGFRSRCTTPLACAACTARASTSTNCDARRGDCGVPSSCWARLPPATYSKHKIRSARNVADIVDLNDVRMLQSGNNIGLVAKAGKLLLAGVCPILKHFYRYDTLQRKLPGLEDDAHASASKDSEDFVARH